MFFSNTWECRHVRIIAARAKEKVVQDGPDESSEGIQLPVRRTVPAASADAAVTPRRSRSNNGNEPRWSETTSSSGFVVAISATRSFEMCRLVGIMSVLSRG